MPNNKTSRIYEAKTGKTEGRQSLTITDGDFSIPLTIMGRTTSQRESKETEDLTNTASWVSRSYKNALPTTHTHSLQGRIHLLAFSSFWGLPTFLG